LTVLFTAIPTYSTMDKWQPQELPWSWLDRQQ